MSSLPQRSARPLRRQAHPVISCQILEEGMQVDFLLEIAPKSGANRLANNSDHRLMIEFGIVLV
jgi:hypothetical protein